MREIGFTMWLIVNNQTLSDKWRELFFGENLNLKSLKNIESLSQFSQTAKGLALTEIGAGIKSAEELKNYAVKYSNISFIIAGQPGKTGNAQISDFLENGADDFVLTNINTRVLLSKIKAHIRRLLPSLNAAKTNIFSKDESVHIDKLARTVMIKDFPPLTTLTEKEFDIFTILVSYKGQVISRAFLMEEIWRQKSGHVNCETVDKHIEALRRKLGTYEKAIQTVYGAGYVFKIAGEKGTGK